MASTAALPSSSSTTTILVLTFSVASAAIFIHYTSPIWLARFMVSAIAAAEQKYLAAVESGLLSESDTNATGVMLAMLQDKVSTMREASLRSSLSWRATLSDILTGHTFAVLQCIWEVRNLQTHIEILGEVKLRTKLRAKRLEPLQTVSLRRRHINH